MKKLFVIVRGDLAAGAQCAQSCHAICAFAVAYPEKTHAWHTGSNNLVVLAAPSELALEDLIDRAELLRVPIAAFREPDFCDQLTAIALGDGAAPLVSSLPLALRPPRAA